eukprot:1920978-Rhodomonas_salina.1
MRDRGVGNQWRERCFQRCWPCVARSREGRDRGDDSRLTHGFTVLVSPRCNTAPCAPASRPPHASPRAKAREQHGGDTLSTAPLTPSLTAAWPCLPCLSSPCCATPPHPPLRLLARYKPRLL